MMIKEIAFTAHNRIHKASAAQGLQMGLCMLLLLSLAGCYNKKVMKEAPASVIGTNVNMTCTDKALLRAGEYIAENNTWGKDNLTGWSQCIGINQDGASGIQARWAWDWPNAGSNIKAYPEIIYGQKPGQKKPTTLTLPKLVNELKAATVTYDVASTSSGSGDLSFDIWLTNTKDPNEFSAPPITHEIMIWLESYGGLIPSGKFIEQVTVDGVLYDLYIGENFSLGWTYIVFSSVESQIGAGNLNLISFFSVLKSRNLISGSEYLASIEFGNEMITGKGETTLNNYSIIMK